MGKFIGIRAGAVVGKDGYVEGMPVSGLQQVEEETPLEEQRPFEFDQKGIFSNHSKHTKVISRENTE